MDTSHFTDAQDSKSVTLCNDLHSIAARLSGLEASIRRISEETDWSCESANILNMLADVVLQTNDEICSCADKVHDLQLVPA